MASRVVAAQVCTPWAMSSGSQCFPLQDRRLSGRAGGSQMDVLGQDAADSLPMRDAAEVAARLRRWVPLGSEIAQAWSAADRVVEDQGRYPACQFDEAGLPLVQMRALIAALRPVMPPSGMVGWLGTPCAALEGLRPADCLQSLPGAVIEAARQHAAQARAAA
jgi:hypothetical protein